jgi:Nif-specific regulatory protein
MADTLAPDKELIDEQALDTRQTLKYAEDLVLTYDALRESERRYRALWHIGKSLHQYVNSNDLISHIILETREAMKAEIVSVVIYDEKAAEWIVYRPNGVSGPISKQITPRFPMSNTMAERVLETGEPEIFPDASERSRHDETGDEHTMKDAQSTIVVPLRIKEKIFGVLEVLNKKDGFFDDKDLFFVTTLAPIVAMALDNARMYAELDRSYKELQVTDKKKDSLIKYTQEENIRLRQAIEKRYRLDQIIGYSDQMIEVFKLCEKVVDSDITVLVEGETGTGKELIARCIHHNSPRKEKSFVTQNCAGIPDTLLASELFGHKKGAFTGAISDKKGLFEVAHGGTVFLDEVAEMPPAMQVSLLRVLQEGEIKPLGADNAKKVDVRVISATNRSLEADVRAGRFRADLLYRLNVFTIELPPLRERIGDIPILAKYFLEKHMEKTRKSITGMSPEAIRVLNAYGFPGNVRELENEIERAVAMADSGGLIETSHLSEKIHTQSALPYSMAGKGTLNEMVESLEKSVLSEAIKTHGGNKTRIAKALGLSRNGLTKKLKRYGL